MPPQPVLRLLAASLSLGLATLCGGAPLSAWASPPDVGEALSPRNASYSMDVRLDVDARLIHGKQVLTWTNTTTHPTSELYYHLYYNAWRNERSSWLSSTRYGRNDHEDRHDEEWAYSEVSAIRQLGNHGRVAQDLTGSNECVQPDDANPHDRSVLRVELPSPVGPGESVDVEMEWEARVPRTFARTGARGAYFFLAQWFPKVGVFEREGDWACHQFIQTEFYADFGVYDVRLNVPTGWVVGATGRETETVDESDGTTTHRFVQADVHDFAWTTSPQFGVHERRFEHEGLPPVDMRLLLMPDHADQVDRYFGATEAALQYYGSWWGAYPYDHVTIVDPAYQSGSGGMEYPTLFTGGSRWIAPLQHRQPESVTVHEAGHQFWYGIMANDEFHHAWLDEGFNSYTQGRVMAEVYPGPRRVRRYLEGFLPVAFDSLVLNERTDGADQYQGFESVLKRDPIAVHSWEYGPGAYKVNSYNKPAMMLRTLENHLGWETFQRGMSTYFERFRFKHPRPEDYFSVMEEVSGRDLGWYFDQAYGDAVMFDYGVDRVVTQNDVPKHGTTDTGGEEGLVRSSVYVRRWGDGVFPIDVQVVFDDGTEVTEQWEGKERWTKFEYAKHAKVETVRVDPDQVLVLDVNSVNDSWMRESEADAAGTKWAAQWMLWVQNVMETMAFFS